MTVLSQTLPSVYTDFTEAQFAAELERVHQETEQDRLWIEQYELQTFATDKDILEAVIDGKLQRISRGAGYATIMRLSNWDPSRSDKFHEFHYSPPFAAPQVSEVIEFIGREWHHDMGEGRALTVTSLTRSDEYQDNLSKKSRKLTISQPNMVSSHQVGYAFDIDGCGLVEADDAGNVRQINPRFPGFQPGLIHESRLVLQGILSKLQSEDAVHYVEELPGTQEHCFHVCVNPGISSL